MSKHLRATLTVEEVSFADDDGAAAIVGVRVVKRWMNNGLIPPGGDFKDGEDAFAYKAATMAREAFRDHAANIGAWPPKPDEPE